MSDMLPKEIHEIEADLLAGWPAVRAANNELTAIIATAPDELGPLADKWYTDLVKGFMAQIDCKQTIYDSYTFPLFSDEREAMHRVGNRALRRAEIDTAFYIFENGQTTRALFGGDDERTERFVGRIIRNVLDEIQKNTGQKLACAKTSLNYRPGGRD